MDINKAPISEPTAVALHAVELGESNLKKKINDCRALVIGGGAIGLLSALILEKIKNCGEIYLTEPNTKRGEVCSNNLKSKCLKPSDKLIVANPISNFDKCTCCKQNGNYGGQISINEYWIKGSWHGWRFYGNRE